MWHKNINDIGFEDIKALVQGHVPESKHLEYKRELPVGDEAKAKIAAEISAFANAAGGDIIFGIDEQDGDDKTKIALGFSPIESVLEDEAILQIEQITQSRIEPRLSPGIIPQVVRDDEIQGFILVIRVQQSFQAPHMIKKSSRFYSRNSRGKFPLDVSEIRHAFLASDTYVEQIKNWIRNRMLDLKFDETPIRIHSPHRSMLVIHLVPIGSFVNRAYVDVFSDQGFFLKNFGVPEADICGHRITIDGIAHVSTDISGVNVDQYCQVFRHGQVEAVSGRVLMHNSGTKEINPVRLERLLISSISGYLRGFAQLGISPPIHISASLLNCKDATVPKDFESRGLFVHSKNHVPSDDTGIFSIQLNSEAEFNCIGIRGFADAVWNLFGEKASPHYNEDGYNPPF